MGFDEFFTDGDKPYAENLNDSLALIDAFDVTVPVKMPDLFNGGEFSSDVNVSRKCGVGIVTLKSVDTGVTIGTSSISGSGDVVFRIYPNFNSFYKWNKIIFEKTGTVSVAFKKTDGTNISATVGNDGIISEASALKQLQEIDVVITLTSATISSILIEFVNNHSNRTRTGALLEASQLTNIDGVIAEDSTDAVNGGTVYTALDDLNTGLSGDISDLDSAKEDVANKVTTLDDSDTHYPSCSAVKNVTDTKENSNNKVTTLDSNSSHYPSCTAVNAGLTLKENVNNKVTTLDNSDSHYPSSKAVKTVTDGKENSSNKVTTLDNSTSHFPTTSAIQPLWDWIVKLVETADITVVPHFIQNPSEAPGFYKIGASVVKTNLPGVVLVVDGSRGTINSKEDTVRNIFDELADKYYHLADNVTFQVVSPYTNNIIYQKTFDKNGNVVS